MRISDWSSDVCSSDLKAIALSAFAALTACGGGGDDAAENIEASADNQADMLEMEAENLMEIGRASCRERVWQRVDLGGRRIINKKKTTRTHTPDKRSVS